MSIPSDWTWTAAGGGGTCDIAYPAETASNSGGVGDMLILEVAYGNSAGSAPTTPAGWTIVPKSGGGNTIEYGGTGSWGVNTGSRGIAVYYKVSAGTETGTLTVTNGGTGTDRTMRCAMTRFSCTSATWIAPVGVVASDTTSGTGFSIAPGVNPGSASGDVLLGCGAWVPTTSTTSGSTSSALTWTGAGLGSTTPRNTGSTLSTTNGVRLNTYAATVSSAATGNCSFALTLSAAGAGPGAMVRLREDTSGAVTAYAGNDVAVEPGTTVTLNASESQGTITAYSWSKVSGTTSPTINNSSAAVANYEAPFVVGGDELTFRVTTTPSATDDVTHIVLEPTEYADDGAGNLVPLQLLTDDGS